MTSLLNGLGGLNHGSFFRPSDNVDLTQPPGMSSTTTTRKKNDDENHREKEEEAAGPLLSEIQKILTGEAFLYSPNLTWFLIAVVVWSYDPYDVTTFDDLNNDNDKIFTTMTTIFWNRFVLNNVVALTYISFWHVVLYIYPKVGSRPFIQNRTYNTAKVVHNMFYTFLGIVQWTVTEVAFVYCYKTERLIYPNVLENDSTTNNNNDNGDDTTNIKMYYYMTFWILSAFVPSWRDVHFYFCHRMIHIRCLYKYIHSLHHRNTDIEPFAGLCMHPVEHLYYYTCYLPVLILSSPYFASNFPVVSSTAPFLLFWTGLHTVISPAASHSGYEDHFSADVAHYLHHRYCECNYGAGINFDAYFGTYQATLRTSPSSSSSSTSKITNTVRNDDSDGNGSDDGDDDTKNISTSDAFNKAPPPSPSSSQRLDPKATLIGWIPEHPWYHVGYISMYVLVITDTMMVHSTSSSSSSSSSRVFSPIIGSIILSFVPALWAVILYILQRPSYSSSLLSWRKLILAPFDKDSMGSLVLHLTLGIGFGIVPATILSYHVLS